MFAEAGSILLQVLFIFNIVVGSIVVFFGRKDPSATWAWLMVILFIPYIGFFIYLILGLDSRKHKVFSGKAKQDEKLLEIIYDAKFEGFKYVYNGDKNVDLTKVLNSPTVGHLDDLVQLNYSAGSGVFSENNEVKLYHEGNSKFDDLVEDISNAKNYVHLLYYIMHDDELGNRIINSLAKKASEGVEVKLLIDAMGCHSTPRKFYKPLEDAGGQVAMFLPPALIRLNYRNHRKIAVIDGYIGYVGGLNIGDEYIGKKKRFGFWRDTHIRIHGDSAKELEARFIFDWNFCSEYKIPISDKYFPMTKKISSGIPIQIVSSGPDTRWPNIHLAYTKMITEADKSLYIQTPYFAPDDSVFQAIKISALSGIDVRIMIPAIPDHPFVYWSSLSFLGELLEVGVKCYEYEGGFVHSKLMVIDGLVSSTGTANMDVRSFKLNFEVNAFIYDRKISEEFQREFIKDIEKCRQITTESYAKRTNITKIKEAFSRLISPLI